MTSNCEHPDGNLAGKCSICGNMVCDECFRSLFNQMICELHPELEDETAWVIAGCYNNADSLDEVTFLLDEQQITSLKVEVDADTVELYIPSEDKEGAWEIYQSSPTNSNLCAECKIQFSSDIILCPLCGTAAAQT